MSEQMVSQVAQPAQQADGFEFGQSPHEEPSVRRHESKVEKPTNTGWGSDTKEEAPKPEPTEQEKQAKAAARRKLKVDQQEFEVDEAQFERLAQKGAHWERRSAEVVKRERQIAQMAHEAATEKERYNTLMENIGKDPVAALLEYHKGDEAKVRQAIEPFILQKVREELEDEANPHQKAIREANRKAELAQKELENFRNTEKQTKETAERNGLIQHYNKVIINTLDASGLPKTERSVKTLADLMSKAASAGMEYSPEQLADLVREEYIGDIQQVCGNLYKAALEAKKTQNEGQLIKIGDSIRQMFGDDLALALRLSDLARLKSSNGGIPRTQVLETPRMRQTQTAPKSQYMDWDQYAEERKQRAAALQRGEQVKPW